MNTGPMPIPTRQTHKLPTPSKQGWRVPPQPERDSAYPDSDGTRGVGVDEGRSCAFRVESQQIHHTSRRIYNPPPYIHAESRAVYTHHSRIYEEAPCASRWD